MDERTYQTVLENWHFRADECRQIAADILGWQGPSDEGYQQARAMMLGYRAAIEAAEVAMGRRSA